MEEKTLCGREEEEEEEEEKDVGYLDITALVSHSTEE